MGRRQRRVTRLDTEAGLDAVLTMLAHKTSYTKAAVKIHYNRWRVVG